MRPAAAVVGATTTTTTKQQTLLAWTVTNAAFAANAALPDPFQVALAPRSLSGVSLICPRTLEQDIAKSRTRTATENWCSCLQLTFAAERDELVNSCLAGHFYQSLSPDENDAFCKVRAC